MRGTSPYRALLLDYGGVLTTSMTLSLASFCAATGVSPERLKDVLAAAYSTAADASVTAADVHDLVRGVETGRLDPAEFDRRLAAALSEGLSEPIQPHGLTERLFEQLRPDERMRAAVGAARRHGIRTGLVSNTWGPPGPAAGEYEPLFDVIVRSHELGVRKPDPEIFLRAASIVGVPPAECIFVDDIPINVDGARSVGMAGVLHRDPAITIPKLEGLLGISLGGG